MRPVLHGTTGASKFASKSLDLDLKNGEDPYDDAVLPSYAPQSISTMSVEEWQFPLQIQHFYPFGDNFVRAWNALPELQDYFLKRYEDARGNGGSDGTCCTRS